MHIFKMLTLFYSKTGAESWFNIVSEMTGSHECFRHILKILTIMLSKFWMDLVMHLSDALPGTDVARPQSPFSVIILYL